MKYQFMQQHAQEYSIKKMAKIFSVSRSGYYQFITTKLSARAKENQRLCNAIKTIHDGSRQTYGSPRIWAELRANGEQCSRKRVCKLMKTAGIAAKMHKRFKATTIVHPKATAAPNVLQQDFTATAPNQRWVADITLLKTQEGWLYVAAILDLFSRSIVGLAMKARMTADLVTCALQQALIHRKPESGLIHHSDRGSQYTSEAFKALAGRHDITLSMSSTGNCYDNAVMESFFHTLKTEHTYFEHYDTREQATQSLFEYVEVFYNRQRRHSTLGYLSPLDFEKQWQQHAVESFSS